jgi:3',5'-cyclic AMP phosphodiesterase CpdA
MKRRHLIKALGLGMGAAVVPASIRAGLPEKQPVLRVAHITDVHIMDKLDAAKGLATCLQHIQQLSPKVDFIISGGDAIMDALHVKELNRVDGQWKVWNDVIRLENSLPLYHCIGNHDVWAAAPASDPLFGKQYALEKMALKQRYYTFGQSGWNFIVLDSTFLVEKGYTARLDQEQMEWLSQTLAQLDSSQPVCVVSHIPILTATGFYPENIKDGQWVIPGSWMHEDFQQLNQLFSKYPNVKACLSGHMHLLDQVVYNGVNHFCNGAVSGNWWGNKRYYETEAGYAIMDFYTDGSVSRTYIDYGWK